MPSLKYTPLLEDPRKVGLYSVTQFRQYFSRLYTVFRKAMSKLNKWDLCKARYLGNISPSPMPRLPDPFYTSGWVDGNSQPPMTS